MPEPTGEDLDPSMCLVQQLDSSTTRKLAISREARKWSETRSHHCNRGESPRDLRALASPNFAETLTPHVNFTKKSSHSRDRVTSVDLLCVVSAQRTGPISRTTAQTAVLQLSDRRCDHNENTLTIMQGIYTNNQPEAHYSVAFAR